MSKGLGITKGEWSITEYETPNLYDQPELSNIQISTSNKDICVLWPIMKPIEHDFLNREEEDLEEVKANAKLIAEAGTVANETGKTPRQLLEERDRLLELVKDQHKVINKLVGFVPVFYPVFREANDSSNKAIQTIKDIEAIKQATE